MKWNKVSKDEFYKWIEDYQNRNSVKLERNISTVCEPPLLTINDFSKGLVWPDSVVAKAILYDGTGYHDFKSPEYFIK